MAAVGVFFGRGSHLTSASTPPEPAPTAAIESSPPPAVRPEPPAAVASPSEPDVVEHIKHEAESNRDETVRKLARDLLDKYERHDEIARAYDETHQLYVERFVKHAPQAELATFQAHLDDLMREMPQASQDIYVATTKMNDAYVAERMAALNLGDVKGK